MKILEVVDFFKPSWEAGGIVRVCYEISKRLADKGHEITVYTTDGFKSRLEVKKNQPVDVEGMEVYYFRNVSNFLAKRNFYLPYLLPYVAKKDIQKFDIIHIHTFRSLLAVPIWYYAKKYNIPYILQVHGTVLPISQKQRLKKKFDIFFGYKILRDASKVIALTKTEAEQYKKMGVNENKIEIVPNGVDLSEYDNLPKKGEFRRKYKIGDDEKMILYIGRLHKSKGIDLLVKAFADLSKELGNVRLVLLGPDDGYQLALNGIIKELKIDNKVLFTGFVNNEEKMAAFVDADVFVTPSFTGFPVTFLEACACGTPVITTNKGDELDWIDEKVGYVVEYDKDQLRDAITKVLRDEELRRRFGEEGKRLVMEEFGWDKIIIEVEGIYSCESHVAKRGI
jgi:glycosyltransferase involved in cell wall biosynthesis